MGTEAQQVTKEFLEKCGIHQETLIKGLNALYERLNNSLLYEQNFKDN